MGSSQSSVERSGGAHGLVEVLISLGDPATDEWLDAKIFDRANDSSEFVRDGVLAIVFMPTSFDRDECRRYLSRMLRVIVAGLADESEPCRDTALRAGKVCVKRHAFRMEKCWSKSSKRRLSQSNGAFVSHRLNCSARLLRTIMVVTMGAN